MTTNNITFRPAVRENVGLWINLIGGTGSGKTFTAMRLASGICGDKPFALIDTENRRGLHYADQFNFHHAELNPPFRPEAYTEAVLAADSAGYPVIVIDSGSHVWAGDGGILDWQEEEVDRMAGDDWKRRESVKMAAWIKPKMAHKKMVQKLLQVKAHIILCLRAEEKIEMVKVNGKTEIHKKQSLTGQDGWIPVCEKNLPFEATCSFLLTADKPGVPHPIKLQEQHKALFPLGVPITEESGKQLAAWASGGTVSLGAKRLAIVGHFGSMGISPERICAAIGVPNVSSIKNEHIAILKAFAVDIKNKVPIEKIFPPIDHIDPSILEPPNETDGDDEPEEEISPLERLRADVIAKLEEMPERDRKNVLAGKTPPSKADETELRGLLAEIEN